MNGFSVIMPTFRQAGFIQRAIKSLLDQTYPYWELIIINDGSTDNTERKVKEFLPDERIKYIHYPENKGLGYALNKGLDSAKYDYIAYLPSDDFFYKNHLEVLMNEFLSNEDIILAFTKAVSEKNLIDPNTILFKNHSLQLVQTAHKKADDRWLERDEMVTVDLFEMFWSKLISKGLFSSINIATANWTHHTHQRHRHISEDHAGGLNIYRQYYKPAKPLHIKVSKYKTINEYDLYKDFRADKVKINSGNKGLKILIVGELAYNAERILALEEYGHKLYGLWMNNRVTYSFTTVGPLPFGNVIDIPYENYKQKIKEIKPDIIYGCLNIGVESIINEVRSEFPDIPFVWHYKEGPTLALSRGYWEQVIDIYNNASGNIFLNPELEQWCNLFANPIGLSMILDGDLPKKEYFTEDFSEKISSADGEIHTVVPGRLMGLTIDDIKSLAKDKIHIHLYSENYHAGKQNFNRDALKAAPHHFHVHSHCPANRWVSEFSKYDAGWLHCFNSKNDGDIMSATWDDLNMPARMNTLAAAGLPMIVKRNEGHVVAMRNHLQKYGIGIYYDDFNDLASQLYDSKHINHVRNNVLENRRYFTFDHYVPELTEFFRKVIEHKKSLS